MTEFKVDDKSKRCQIRQFGSPPIAALSNHVAVLEQNANRRIWLQSHSSTNLTKDKVFKRSNVWPPYSPTKELYEIMWHVWDQIFPIPVQAQSKAANGDRARTKSKAAIPDPPCIIVKLGQEPLRYSLIRNCDSWRRNNKIKSSDCRPRCAKNQVASYSQNRNRRIWPRSDSSTSLTTLAFVKYRRPRYSRIKSSIRRRRCSQSANRKRIRQIWPRSDSSTNLTTVIFLN
jgi:hypothetical protein